MFNMNPMKDEVISENDEEKEDEIENKDEVEEENGHERIIGEDGKERITEVDSCVLKFCKLKLSKHEKDMKNSDSSLFKRTEEIIKQFENKPYDFYENQSNDHFYENMTVEKKPAFVYMGDKRIRYHGIFYFFF